MPPKYYALEYIGNGDFLPGIPSRNLTTNEVKYYGGKRKLIASGLYKVIETKQDKKAIERENKSIVTVEENKEL